MNTKYEGLVLLQKSNTLGRVLVIAIVLIMTISAFFAGLTNTAYAAAIGQKNKQACDDCKAVVAGTPPEGYTPIAGTALGGGKYAVYSGGNSYSKANKVEIDTDTTDFANPLPYGDVYVDANKLKWDNPKDFIIDIQDDRFQWVSVTDTPLKDAEGNESTNDPMGVEGAGPLVYTGDSQFRGICYVGPLKSYLEDIKSATKDDGYTNVIEPKEGKEYLYQITYKNAVTLPDGTKGNLVLTMKKVQIETSVTVDADHLYTPAGANYSYANAFVKVQGENQLSNDTGYNVFDANKNRVNQQETQIMTAAEAESLMNTINSYLTKENEKLQKEDFAVPKTIRNATGNILDFDIEVTDAGGNRVNGTISYAAHDMDFESAQNIWGRPVDSKFAEAMTIVSGSQSYALVPNYNHLDATTRDAGWLPVGPGEDPLERALSIEKDPDVNNNADGVRFASPFLLNYRDANGKFDDVIFNNTAVTTFQGDSASANNNELINKNGSNKITNIAKKNLYAKLKAKGHSVSNWKNVTAEMAWQTLGNYSWKTYRNDDDTSFDSGFAVLLDSKESKIQWSGSRVMGSNVNTTLFDPTLFTYIEPTHGTGGGIYFESYDITDNCKVQRREGVSTMGRGVDATVTAVPEDGYRVNTIMVGGEGLSNSKTYNIDELTFLDNGEGHYYFDNENNVVIEDNLDGTYDVTVLNIQDPRHIHVDFSADYHFYKVWKGEKDPTTLNMTATPYAFVFRDVFIEGTKYTISNKGNKFTDPDGNPYTLENNSFTVGEGAEAVTYYLEGNSLVTYKYNQTTNEREKDNTYPIRLDYVQNGDPVEFKVTKADADNPSETHVTKGTEDGYTTWKITYPAEGYKTKSGSVWPALPIESDPPAHNINHVERNYWFVTEEAPGWSLAYYDNSKAEAPGKIDDASSRKEIYKEGEGGDWSAWAQASTKDYTQSEAVIRSAADNDHAYMSVFNTNNDSSYSWGGKIVNVPAVVVNAEKTWKDFSNAYETRQDVWFHIDAQLEDEEKITDFLPPQKLSSGATGGKANSDGEENSVFTVTWGDRKAYSLEGYTGYSNVRVVGTAADIPRKDSDGNPLYYQQDEKDSHKYLPVKVGGFDDKGRPVYVSDDEGITYYVNELEDRNGANKTYKFTIRETDANGNELDKTEPTEFLYGYKSEVGEVKKDGEQATLDGVKVDSYTGKVKNTLETVDFTVKKVWVDGNNADNKRPADGAVTYTVKKQSGTEDPTVLTALPVKESATQGTTDVTSDYKNGKITVKTANGDTVEFSKLPKYDTSGNEIEYTVDEAAISGYKKNITGDMSTGYTVTNTQKTEVYVEKEWDDEKNQDGVRPKTVEFELLKGDSATGTKLTLSESNVWKDKFANLDKYDGDTLIVYSVQEVPFDTPNTDIEYTASGPTGEGTQSDPFIIKNSRTPEKITIRAEKIWDDDAPTLDDALKAKIRFNAVFKLFADGKEVEGSTKEVATGSMHAENRVAEWEVPKYRNGGTLIAYDVFEDKPNTRPYSVVVSGDAENGFKVTNTYPPVTEYRTVTRTIVYTYIDENGKTASATKTQTVRFKRTPTEMEEEGTIVAKWTDWIIDTECTENDLSAVTSPTSKDDPKLEGWVPNKDIEEWDIEYDDNGNPMNAFENVIYTPLPPTAVEDETYGAPGQPQTGKPTFEVQTPKTPGGSDNIIVDYKLLDPETGKPTNETTVNAFDSKTGKKIGTYTLNEDGTITFTPDDSTYIGDPKPVGIQGTDSNGKTAETTYTPHIVDNTKTVKRTIHYRYLTEDGTEVTKDVVQEVTFTGGTVDPKNGTVSWPEGTKNTMSDVTSPSVDGYTPDRNTVPERTVTPEDGDTEETVVYLPKGVKATPDVTYGLPNQEQTGTPGFTMETSKLPDGSDNSITIRLIDPKTGKPTDSKTVDAVDENGNKVGTYTLNDDGTVTFKPKDGYVGNPKPLELEGTDRLGKKAKTTYTPHIVDPTQKDTATRKIHYTYVTKIGKKVTGDVTQTVDIYKHAKKVDPKTGEVLEWGDWEPTKFPALKNPDDKVDGMIWFTDDAAGEQVVTKPGKQADVHVVYEKIPYTVTYLDGDHGESDGKGDQSGEDYGKHVKGGNGVNPAKGYHFTGKYSYVITDHNGNVIQTGETDDPKSLDIIGNIKFTPIYAPNRYTIKYDPNGGSGTMDDQHFTGEDDSATSKENQFTRDGYKFGGFKAKLPNGKYLKDENGNDIIFMSVDDFIEYLHEQGDGGEITLEAQWIKDGVGSSVGVDTGDSTSVATWMTMLILAITCIAALLIRRKRHN